MLATALRVVGQDAEVPLLGGGRSRYVNLDFAASAPALVQVKEAVEELLPWYSSVHRGSGWLSRLSTQAYESARDEVAAFVGARADDIVVFTRNTTDAMNLLASALPDHCHVIAFGSEHHANLLPWRSHRATFLDTPASPAESVALLEETLAALPPGPRLVTVTGASNVTGELWPVAALADVAHLHDALILVDAAQLAPHAPIDMAAWNVDYLAVSGHKLYAPYGAGALVGRRAWLTGQEPYLAGGGAVRFVSIGDVAWADLPERQEAGSPNVVGAVAMAAACRTLRDYGMERLAAEEQELAGYLRRQLRTIPGLTSYQLWVEEHPRIGVATFNIDHLPYGLVAAALSGEHGVAVRDGCFCAHPLMMRLLGIDECSARTIRDELVDGSHARVPGAVRMSTGAVTTTADIDQAVAALCQIAGRGPRWDYRQDPATGHYDPVPDDRPWPELAVLQPSRGAALQDRSMA